MIFACDVDGVIANFTEGFSRLLNKLDGKDRLPIVKDNQAETWEWRDWYALDEIPRDELDKLLEDAWENYIKKHGNSLWSGLKPLFPDAMEMLNKAAREHPIIFMTRRDGPGAWQETSSWLRRYGIDNPMIYVIKPGEEKGDVCRKLGIKTIIDDSPRYAPELLEKGINVVMPWWGYNEEYIDENYSKEPRLFPTVGLKQSLKKCRDIEENN